MAERMKDIELLLGTSSSVLTSIETPFTSLLALLRERVGICCIYCQRGLLYLHPLFRAGKRQRKLLVAIYKENNEKL